jgi:hypothetical protein
MEGSVADGGVAKLDGRLAAIPRKAASNVPKKTAKAQEAKP